MKKNYSPTLVTIWLTLTILFCWGQVSTSTAESLIVEAPMDQIVPVNSTAMFSCKVTGILVWEIDGREITSERQNAFCSERSVCVNGTLDNSPDETTESVLLVAAIGENNGSMIRCLASETEISTPERSDVVFLEIFDRPEPPTSLVFLPLSPLHLNLSWDAPFIFPGSEIIINYAVTVRNVNTSEEIQREGLEVTYYIFNGTEGSSVCDVYQFSVVAVNSAGRSDRSENISSHLPTLPSIEASVESLKHDVIFDDGSTVALIKISFEPAESCDLNPVTGYDVMLHGDSTNTTVSGSHFENGRVNFEITNAKVNFQYRFSIVAFNSIGNTTSEETKCYTTDVQDASISMKADDIVVTCSFAQGSQAQGCQVQLNSPMENITLNISRLNASDIHVVVELSYSPTCYDVCALDWEADGTIGELCIPASVNLPQTEIASCSNPPEPDKESNTLLIIEVIVGVVVGFLIIVVVVAIVSYRCMRARQDVRVQRSSSKNKEHGPVPRTRNKSPTMRPNSYLPDIEEIIDDCHPTTEHSNSQPTTLPPVYDVVQNHTKQGPTYAVLENNSIPLGTLPGNQQQGYCEIDAFKMSCTNPMNHESTAVSVSDTAMVPENEILYSEIPSTGTTVD